MGMTPHKLTESSKPRKKNVDASNRTNSSQAVTAVMGGGPSGGSAGSPAGGPGSAAEAATAAGAAAATAASAAKDGGKDKDPEELKIMDLQIQAQREMDARLNKRGLPNGGRDERKSEKLPGDKTVPGMQQAIDVLEKVHCCKAISVLRDIFLPLQPSRRSKNSWRSRAVPKKSPWKTSGSSRSLAKDLSER